GENPELEAPATFWEGSGDGGAGLSLNYKRTHPTDLSGRGENPELEAPATFRGGSGDGGMA
ncbi:MAG: hypothetical protein WCT05_16140, partial [Lentisphaeria bacterium]